MNSARLRACFPVLAALLLASCSGGSISFHPYASDPPAAAQAVPPPSDRSFSGSAESIHQSRYSPVAGTRGMVVSDDREASAWGAEILRRGGNAVDAAVATAFALAVTRPHYAALGGGGFLLYCPKPQDGKAQSCQSIDYREEAPGAATRDLYIRDGKARTDLSQDGALASGVPGVTAGLLLALEKFGSRSRQELLKHPIELAEKGVPVTGYMEAAAYERWDAMNAEARRVLGCKASTAFQSGSTLIGALQPCPVGSSLKQKDLAKVLREISRSGARGFYSGWVAQKITYEIRRAGGILTPEDFSAYRARLREPVRGSYRGMEVVSMPPPSAGGTTLLEMLGYADRADAQGALSQGFGSAATVHALAHGMALAYADRAKYFGDPDQVAIPLRGLLAPAYLDSRWQTFQADHASLPAGAGEPGAFEGAHTTHFSVIDRDGNAVAVTTTINDNFGSGFMPAGTGVMMNDEMDDFSIQPGVPNMFGLVGAEANAVAPRKRPLSSMSPTIVRDLRGGARIVIGAAGGPRITTAVFLSLVNRLRFGMSLVDAVASPRFHQQWRPQGLSLERNGFSAEVQGILRAMGYELTDVAAGGKIHALERFENGRVWGVADFRGEGAAVAE